MKLGPSLAILIRLSALGAVGKLLLVVRDLLIAQHLGVSDSVDAFMAASMMVLFVGGVLTAAISGALLPILLKTHTSEGTVAGDELLARATGFAGLVALVVAMGMAAAARPIFDLIVPGFDESKRALAVFLFRVMTPSALLAVATAPLVSALYAKDRLLLVTVGPVANGVVTVLVVSMGLGNHGLVVVAVASLLGAASETLVVIGGCRSHGISLRPRWPRATATLLEFVRQSAPLALASLLSTVNLMVDQYMASTQGAGGVASLGYGRKLVQMTIPLVSMALSTVYFPRLARLAAVNDLGGLRRTARTCTRAIMAVTIPGTVLLVLASRPLVRLLFERGSFNAADTELVTAVQQAFLLQIPFHLGGIVSVRLLSALGRNSVITAITIVNLVANLVGNVVLMRYYGVVGIALSTSVVFLLSFAQVQFMARRALNRRPRQEQRA